MARRQRIRRRRKLKTWIYFPLTILVVGIATLIFYFVNKGDGSKAEVTPTPTGAVVSAAEPTPTPDVQVVRLFAYNTAGKWGYKDQTGKTRIDPTYAKAAEFSEGLAFVADQTGKYGVIDMQGNQISAFNYDDVRPYSQGYAAVKFGELWGYIDSNGNEVIRPAYSSASDFSESLAKVGVDGKFMYIDAQGNQQFDAKYDKAQDFSEGLAFVGDKDSEGVMRYRILDVSMQTSDKIVASIGRVEGVEYSGGLAAVKLESGKYTFYNTLGKTPTAFEDKTYEQAQNFSEDLAAVKDGGLWGYIDNTGKVIIPLAYEDAQPFSQGVAGVKINGLWTYIDKSGNMLANFSNYDSVTVFESDYAVVTKDGSVSVIDLSGVYSNLYFVEESGAEGEESTKIVKTTSGSGSVNMRKEASQDSDILTQISNGATVTIIGTEGEWAQITYDSTTGYVKAEYLADPAASASPTASP